MPQLIRLDDLRPRAQQCDTLKVGEWDALLPLLELDRAFASGSDLVDHGAALPDHGTDGGGRHEEIDCGLPFALGGLGLVFDEIQLADLVPELRDGQLRQRVCFRHLGSRRRFRITLGGALPSLAGCGVGGGIGRGLCRGCFRFGLL